MKQLNKITMGLLLFAFLGSPYLKAQEEESEAKVPTVLIVTTLHWNTDISDGSQEDWLANAKAIHENVTMKNDLIMHTNYMNHYFTADNSESKLISLYANWEDVELADARSGELAREAWPDSLERRAIFAEQNSYYASMHSDEIYTVLDGAKFLDEQPTEPLIYYVRISQTASPADAVPGEFKELRMEYVENIIHKNDYVKAYYVYRHMWGADSRDFVEVFVFNSLADIEPYFDKNQELLDAKWSEEEQKAIGERSSKYWTGFHADYIYRNTPELTK